MKSLILVILLLGILGSMAGCTDYQALYLEKQSYLNNALQTAESLRLQNVSLQQDNANLRSQLASLQSQYQSLASQPPQIQYVDKPVYVDRYVQVPVYVPAPRPPMPRPPIPPLPRPPLPKPPPPPPPH